MFTVLSLFGIYWCKVMAKSQEAAPQKCSLKIIVPKLLKQKEDNF